MVLLVSFTRFSSKWFFVRFIFICLIDNLIFRSKMENTWVSIRYVRHVQRALPVRVMQNADRQSSSNGNTTIQNNKNKKLSYSYFEKSQVALRFRAWTIPDPSHHCYPARSTSILFVLPFDRVVFKLTRHSLSRSLSRLGIDDGGYRSWKIVMEKRIVDSLYLEEEKNNPRHTRAHQFQNISIYLNEWMKRKKKQIIEQKTEFIRLYHIRIHKWLS